MTTTAPSAPAHDLLAGFGPFDSMPIGGRWRPGGGAGVLTDHDPWSGDQLAELRPASAADVEEAYDVARRAQVGWAQRLPAERAEVMLRAAAIIEERHDEVAAWVTAESGGTVGKVAVELAVTRAVFLEAAGMTHHAEGAILPSDIPGKENRVYRRPVGVVCLISPWDFPIYLTSRSLAPALALGQRGRAEALVGDPGDGWSAPGSDPRAGRTARGRSQRRGGAVVGDRRRARRESGAARPVVHRLDRGRDRDLAHRRSQATAPGARRKRPPCRPRRRRPPVRRGVRGLRVVLQLRSDLHDRQPGDRRSHAPRRLRRGVRRAGPWAHGRRSVGPAGPSSVR